MAKSTISFEEFVSDVLGLQDGLMSHSELAEARASYAQWVAPKKTPKPAAVAAKAGRGSGPGVPRRRKWGAKSWM